MNIVTTPDGLADACKRLARAPYITVDTEFLRDASYWPKLCLIQIASPDEALIVDPLAPGMSLKPFYQLMRNTKVIKVFHAARQDIEIFYHDAKVIPDPLFDTQIAAMVCGFGESVGYETLVNKLAKGTVDKSSRFTDWSRRPLSDKQLHYALSDVTYLRQIYEALARRLANEGRTSWVAEEMAILQNPETYELRPEDAWRRLKARVRGKKAVAVLSQLAAWRERQAQERDVPRGRILKDDALYELASQQPSDLNALDRLRGVPKGFANSRLAPSLLEAIAAGQSLPDDQIPTLSERGPAPAQGTGPLVELLKVLLKLKCEEAHVAQKLVATTSDLEQIASDDKADIPAMHGWRYDLFGRHAVALKRGELALMVRKRKIAIVEMPAQTQAAD